MGSGKVNIRKWNCKIFNSHQCICIFCLKFPGVAHIAGIYYYVYIRQYKLNGLLTCRHIRKKKQTLLKQTICKYTSQRVQFIS